MKLRTGFVSNSSSSSFVISKHFLSPCQITELLDFRNSVVKYGFHESDANYWDINENDHEIYGFSIMDNLGIEQFLERLGIDPRYFHVNSDG